jgi:hypothetical protein
MIPLHGRPDRRMLAPMKSAVGSLALATALGLNAGNSAESLKSGETVTTNAAPIAHAHTNHLAREKSPYLLQHQHNPVDWYAWGEEAFAKARAENKPIFLSIGYSTCHWCHVMERESFESENVAKYLNEHFVSIKVDREERPDVDKIYMTFVQATSGSGGWPMSVWLTPEFKPFFGGTYFPPSTRWGRPGFLEVLAEVARAWQQDRPRILSSADTIVTRLRDATGRDDGPIERMGVADLSALAEGIAAFAETFDRRHGGFGGRHQWLPLAWRDD